MYNVFAVILTYNRKDLLKRCLDAVYSQTRLCEYVIVIDNASSDGTQQMLSEGSYPGLMVHVLKDNIGASGGFNAGLRLAYQKGADLVWTMDDDVIPEPGALHDLLAANELLKSKGKKAAFLLSKAVTENGLVTNTPVISNLNNGIGYRDWPELLELGLVPVQRATFVSILLPRATLAQHGLPITAMFIWGEDSEFTLRVTQDIPGYFVGTSKVQHLRQESGPISVIAETNPMRLKLYRHYIRNKLFIARKFRHLPRYNYSIKSEAYKLSRLIFVLLIRGDFYKAKIVLSGMLESLWFFPVPEAAETPVEKMKTSMRSLDLQCPKQTGENKETQDKGSLKLGPVERPG
ncbi:glycosyltransferase family 2 protein [Halomonas sp. Bachu 37]|uniref:glycosyltransferase family 2 protein n=1 Tax=Halomonas kashgarensis TaxID=3084920 RepID=UPI003216FBA7